MNIFNNHTQLYAFIIPSIIVPILLVITFFIMGIEVKITTK